MNSLPLLQTGSVKDIYGQLNKAPYVFKYSDRYSVFDWGEMPDSIEGKGCSLAAMANFFFEVLAPKTSWEEWQPSVSLSESQTQLLKSLKEKGVTHHGIGLVDENIQRTKDFTDSYAVKPMNIVRPEFLAQVKKYDYSNYRDDLVDTLVPLEVIFRFDITEASSLLKRTNDQQYVQSLGLNEVPKAGSRFDNPIIEFSTKLESTDRYITPEEAQKISHMTDVEIQELKDLSSLLALRLKDVFKEIDVNLHDGKFEFAFACDQDGKRYFQLIDSIGPDELRLTYHGVQLSKECLRNFYRGSEWHRAVEQSKKIANERGTPNWKSICLDELHSKPAPLAKEYSESMAMMYKTLANSLYKKYFNREVFPGCWEMDTLIKNIPKR